jgi:hypothetical protein
LLAYLVQRPYSSSVADEESVELGQYSLGNLSFNLTRVAGVKTDGFRVNVRIFCSVVPTIQTISVTGILTVARTLHPSTVLAQVDGRIGVVPQHRPMPWT